MWVFVQERSKHFLQVFMLMLVSWLLSVASVSLSISRTDLLGKVYAVPR